MLCRRGGLRCIKMVVSKFQYAMFYYGAPKVKMRISTYISSMVGQSSIIYSSQSLECFRGMRCRN